MQKRLEKMESEAAATSGVIANAERRADDARRSAEQVGTPSKSHREGKREKPRGQRHVPPQFPLLDHEKCSRPFMCVRTPLCLSVFTSVCTFLSASQCSCLRISVSVCECPCHLRTFLCLSLSICICVSPAVFLFLFREPSVPISACLYLCFSGRLGSSLLATCVFLCLLFFMVYSPFVYFCLPISLSVSMCVFICLFVRRVMVDRQMMCVCVCVLWTKNA